MVSIGLDDSCVQRACDSSGLMDIAHVKIINSGYARKIALIEKGIFKIDAVSHY